VAAFRFSSVRDSYASRMGDSRDVGVIGVAVFQELQRYVAPPRSPIEDMRGGGDPAHGFEGMGTRGREAETSAAAPMPETQSLARKEMPRKDKERPGLGTEFGEQRESHVYETEFERASAQPAAVLTVRYNDRQGLVAMGVDLSSAYPHRYEAELRQTAQPFRRDPGFSEPPPGWNAY
jgi:hypothetical protein